MKLKLLPEKLAVVKLSPEAEVPAWATTGSIYSLTRTKSELSIICQQDLMPAQVEAQTGFRGLMVEGPLAFSEVGILASLATPLAEAAISIFVLSTYDTDYLLLQQDDLPQALAALESAGHEILGAG